MGITESVRGRARSSRAPSHRKDLQTYLSLTDLDGYARLDLRMTANNELYFIEANPNPILAGDEDFAQSALKAGLSYPQLVERILRLGATCGRE